MNLNKLIAAATLGVALSSVAPAQTTSPIVSEDFTGRAPLRSGTFSTAPA